MYDKHIDRDRKQRAREQRKAADIAEEYEGWTCSECAYKEWVKQELEEMRCNSEDIEPWCYTVQEYAIYFAERIVARKAALLGIELTDEELWAVRYRLSDPVDALCRVMETITAEDIEKWRLEHHECNDDEIMEAIVGRYKF